MATSKELQMPLTCRNKKHLEKDTKTMPRITYKHTTILLAIICSALCTWVLTDIGWILWNDNLQKIIVIIGSMFCITTSICWMCSKLVRIGDK